MDYKDLLSNLNQQNSDKFLNNLCKKLTEICEPVVTPNTDLEFKKCSDYFKTFQDIILGEYVSVISENTSGICGKIFNLKEPIYACKDCGTDPTCVLCRNCFVNSEHMNHNYELHSSNGGSCDCGDIEAWKSNARCKIHEINEENLLSPLQTQIDIDEVTKDIPEEVKILFLSMTKIIFDNFKRFVNRPLHKDSIIKRKEELEHEVEEISNLTGESRMNEICLVLYNNEYHNFDQVISLFKRSLSCSAEQAMSFANIVDRDGRCVALTTSDINDAQSKQNDIMHRSEQMTSMELLTKLHHPMYLSLQTFFIHALRWLYEFVDLHPKLRVLICYNLLIGDIRVGNKLFAKSHFIHDIFEMYNDLWKFGRNTCHHFFMIVVFKEPFFKKHFSVEVLKNYDTLLAQFTVDDHNAQDGLLSITCQLFTVISIAKCIIEENNALKRLITLVYDVIKSYCEPLEESQTILQFKKRESNSNKKFDQYERQMRVFYDIKYLLRSLLSAITGIGENDDAVATYSDYRGDLSPQLNDNFLEFYAVFIDLLSLVQDTNRIDRVIDFHVEYDPQWRTGIVLMYEIIDCISLSNEFVVLNESISINALNKLIQAFTTRIVELYPVIEEYQFQSYTTRVVNNHLPDRHISVIKPLHRLFPPLLNKRELRSQLNEKVIDNLYDQALQMVVFSSQQAGNMWIRNGSVPYILSQQMKCLALNPEMFERDLQLLQQMAALSDPKDFILKCIHKFDLREYLEGQEMPTTDMKPILQRAEDLMHLLILTIFYRHRVGVGQGVDKDKIYEYIIFHILCIKPMPHSKIMKKLPYFIQRTAKSRQMTLIDKVSDQSKQSQVIIFNPKKSLVKDIYDRFCPYYTVQDRNEAELAIQNLHKRDGYTGLIEPPKPLDLTEEFETLYGYITDSCFIEVLKRYLHLCTTRSNGVYWTDMLLEMIVHIIGLCLLEDTKLLNNGNPKKRVLFYQACTDSYSKVDLAGCLEMLCDHSSEQQLLTMKWTVRKWHEVRSIIISGNSSENKDNSDNDSEEARQNRLSKTDAAKRRRDLLMNKMMKMQKKFINENCTKEDTKVVTTISSNSEVESMVAGMDDEDNETELHPNSDYYHSNKPNELEEDIVCMVCQEKADSTSDRPMVAIGGAWRSNVLSRANGIPNIEKKNSSNQLRTTTSQWPPISNETNFCDEDFDEYSDDRTIGLTDKEKNALNEWQIRDDTDNESIDKLEPYSLIPLLDHREEIFITTCGHMMHYDCKSRYFSDIIRHKQSFARTKGVLYPRIHNRCPLCKCVCNIDIPIVSNSEYSKVAKYQPIMVYQDWLKSFSTWTLQEENKKPETLISSFKNKIANLFKMEPLSDPGTASKSDLLSSLANQLTIATQYPPIRMKKDMYLSFEKLWSRIFCSSAAELVELGYALAHSLMVWEKLFEKEGNQSLLSEMSERHSIGLNYLIRSICAANSCLASKPQVLGNCTVYWSYLQQLLFAEDKSSLQKMWYFLYPKKKYPSLILEVDFFYIFCSLIFLRYLFEAKLDADDIPGKFFEDRGTYNFYLINLIFEFIAVQALLTLDSTNIDPNADVVFTQMQSQYPQLWSQDKIARLIELRNHVLMKSGLEKHKEPLTQQQVVVGYSQAILPFLRCTAFLMRALSIVYVPKSFDSAYTEVSELLTCLRLSSVTIVSTDSQLPILLPNYILCWLDQIPDTDKELDGGGCLDQSISLYKVNTFKFPYYMPLQLPKLIDLPHHFSDVIMFCLDKGCSLNRQSTGNVFELALCLLCGQTMCLNGYCCRQADESAQSAHLMPSGLSAVNSGAQVHARQAHRGYSLYLGTRSSRVVVLFYRARWHLQIEPIYLDKFGECDPELKRGSPLFLDQQAYKRLERRWLQHSLGTVVQESVIYFPPDFFV